MHKQALHICVHMYTQNQNITHHDKVYRTEQNQTSLLVPQHICFRKGASFLQKMFRTLCYQVNVVKGLKIEEDVFTTRFMGVSCGNKTESTCNVFHALY